MLVVRGRRIVLFDGERPASVHIDRGRITAIGGDADVPAGADIVDVGDLVVSPGVVDTHVHVNEPGRTEWEGFESATRAAAWLCAGDRREAIATTRRHVRPPRKWTPLD